MYLKLVKNQTYFLLELLSSILQRLMSAKSDNVVKIDFYFFTLSRSIRRMAKLDNWFCLIAAQR